MRGRFWSGSEKLCWNNFVGVFLCTHVRVVGFWIIRDDGVGIENCVKRASGKYVRKWALLA